jgi:membrane protein DedA with SNARE-associated domain
LDTFLDSVGALVPLIVFLFAAGESAAFVGLLVPGEVTVILGGVAAGTGRTSLTLTLVAAIAGGIVGDSIGYHLGARFGTGLAERPRFVRYRPHLDAAAAMLERQGWWALVVARFAAVLRSVVPFAAGMSRMRYSRFLPGNVAGAVLWGSAATLVGYFAGDNWPRVEEWLRTGGLLVAVVVIIVAVILLAARWVVRHPQRVLAVADRVGAGRPVRWFAAGVRRTPGILRRTALLWPVAVALVGSLWLFGAVLQDILSQQQFVLFDRPALRYALDNRTATWADVARWVGTTTGPPLVGLGGLVLMIWALRNNDRLRTTAVAVAIGGAWALAQVTDLLVDRPPPPFGDAVGGGFPSAYLATLAAFLVVVLWPGAGAGWAGPVWRYAAAGVLLVVIAAARVVLTLAYPSDMLGGIALGTAWAVATAAMFDPRVWRTVRAEAA